MSIGTGDALLRVNVMKMNSKNQHYRLNECTGLIEIDLVSGNPVLLWHFIIDFYEPAFSTPF